MWVGKTGSIWSLVPDTAAHQTLDTNLHHSRATPQADSQWNWQPQGHSASRFPMELATRGPLPKWTPISARHSPSIPSWNWPLQGHSASRFPKELVTPGPFSKWTSNSIGHSPIRFLMELATPGPLCRQIPQWSWPLQGHSASKFPMELATPAPVCKQTPNRSGNPKATPQADSQLNWERALATTVGTDPQL